MANRDERRKDLHDRLMQAFHTDAPSHGFRESASFPGTCYCGMSLAHPVHSAIDSADTGQEPTGVMIALFPSVDIANQLAVKGGEDSTDLHVTLAYLPDGSGVNMDDLCALAQEFAATYGQPLIGEISGMGVFTNAAGAVTYASVDLPTLPEFRQALIAMLDANGFDISRQHGYTPHMTLAYEDRRNIKIPNMPVTFDSITVAAGSERHTYPLETPVEASAAAGGGGTPVDDSDSLEEAPKDQLDAAKAQKPHAYVNPAGEMDYDGEYPDCALCNQEKNAVIHGGNAVDDLVDSGTIVTTAPKRAVTVTQLGLQQHVVSTRETQDVTQAFVMDINGKTILTGPAEAMQPVFEKALSPNPHMLWMEGRFVGGEKANRNGAFWSSGDLEMGEPTVRYGPLNWLHEARHVIGVLGDSRLMERDLARDAALDEPYIQVAAGIWKWIYPDEAMVVQQASDAGRLWYSMECISDQVQCVGENGCGATASYGDYIQQIGGSCAHMAERSATRRFVKPTFLGGAVIVPPVRPGWANADARVMVQAAALAERAYIEAGAPDMTASEWEQMMAGVVAYAQLGMAVV